MAEIVLKVKSGANYVDGDILAAFNNRMIRCVHAQHICHVKNAGGGVGVHRNSAHVTKDFFENTHQYRFERISKTEVKRILLSDLTEEVFDSTPRIVDGQEQYTNVELFVRLRLRHARHTMFGTAGAETWYGGRKDFSDTALDLVWNAIETKTSNREVDFKSWPCGANDCRSHLFIAVLDFNDVRARELVEPDLVTPHKRKHFIDFRNDLGLSAKNIQDIDDKTLKVLPNQDAKVDDSIVVKVK